MFIANCAFSNLQLIVCCLPRLQTHPRTKFDTSALAEPEPAAAQATQYQKCSSQKPRRNALKGWSLDIV